MDSRSRFSCLAPRFSLCYRVLMKVLSVIVCAILFFAPLSVIAEGSPMDLPIGAPGWQPNARVFLFNVPFYRQEKQLTCELASMRSALAGIGIRVSEWDLWARVRKDFTPRTRQKDGSIVWGDPNKGFVGHPNGSMPITGYGVFVDPVELLGDWFASSTQIRVDNPVAIDSALRKGYPIIIWSVIGANPYVTTWKTPEGKVIHAPVREHTRVIVGYRGTTESMEGVYIIDPLTGLQYLTWDEFRERNALLNHAGLVVAPR